MAEFENVRLYEPKKRMPHIVAIGGGHGLSAMLRGLKRYTKFITAIVTVADDGGGSGMLREDLGMLPPGDIRREQDFLREKAHRLPQPQNPACA